MKMKTEDQTKTNFLEIIGDSPTTRVIDFLIENDRDSWTLIEIKNNAGIGYSTLKILMPKLLEYDLLEIKKIVGKSKLYTINKNNEIVRKLYELYNISNKVVLKRLQKSLNTK